MKYLFTQNPKVVFQQLEIIKKFESFNWTNTCCYKVLTVMILLKNEENAIFSNVIKVE